LADHPIRVVVADDLRRSRLTVFFRGLLALPHLIWFVLWWALMLPAGFLAWLAVVVLGRLPELLHRFLAAYVRYTTHVFAYLFVAAEPWPGFLGRPGYPVDVSIPPPDRQSRLTALFRGLLALPALLLAWMLAGLQHGGWIYVVLSLYAFTGLASAAGFFAWWASLVLGRCPSGLRNAVVYSLGYMARTNAYVFLLTGRYPNSDPDLVEPRGHLPTHPLELRNDDDGRRSRLTVFFRLLLTLPHLVWLAVWSVAAVLVAVANWVATLALGRSPAPLHAFLVRFVRYSFHVGSFLCLVGNPFPGFVGAEGSYPVDLRIDAERRQHRLKTLFRIVLSLPAAVIAALLRNALALVALFAWFAALVIGRMPTGLQHLGAAIMRYEAQLWAYLLVVTDTYPHATPTVTPPPVAAVEPEPWPSPEPDPEPEPTY